MRSFTTEFKVGLFVLMVIALTAFGYSFFLDGVSPAVDSYAVKGRFETADGLFKGSQVRLAGVEVGAVEEIGVEGGQALLVLRIESRYELPTDTVAEVRASGMLGDKHIRLVPGRAEAVLHQGDYIKTDVPGGDIDEITAQVEDIADDVKAITHEVRELVENEDNTDAVEATLQNIEALTAELRIIAETNRADINATVDAVRRLAEALEKQTVQTGADVDEEMAKLKDATDTLQRTLDDVESITGKVDDGQGTIGALVNDDETIDALNETIEEVNTAVDSFTGLRAEVFYVGRYYVGTQPADTDTFFYGNPLAGSIFNTIGIELHSQEDFWYLFEVNSYPQGTITYEQHYWPETGETYTEWIRKPNYRFTFMMGKRFWNIGLRLGIRENGGGIGADFWFLDDRLKLSADVFDFTFGSYPAIEASGTPNIRLAARVEPVPRLFVEAGLEQVALGIRYGYVTGYGAVGFRFNDDDIKLLLALLPVGN